MLTICICALLVMLAAATPFCSGLHRRPHREQDGTPEGEGQAISIIMAVHDNAQELERNLPAFLTQDYAPGYEIIIVDESSTDETEDVLKRFKHQHNNLYTTFIPESSHYLSRRKLALTLGVKAAHNEWIIITDADCKPNGSNWLQAMSRHCNDSHDLVLGFTPFEQSSKPFYQFERLLTSCYCMRKAQRGMAYRYDGHNLAMRKSVFMSNNGFLKNLKFLRGEYDFIANEHAQPQRTAVAIEPEAHIIQDSPSRKKWANSHLFYMETRRHLERSFGYRMLFNTDTLLLHINYLAQVAAMVYSALTSDWLILGAAVASAMITLALRATIATKAMKLFGVHVSLWSVPFMETRVAWQNLYFMLRHRFSDKYDFIRR
jgi:glycosyltransferase involved in cell wall biosynthesis